MSLLSEAVSSVVQSPNPITYAFLLPPTLANYVTVATCKYNVLVPQLKDTVVEVPLDTVIPPNAVVYNMIIDTPQGMVSTGPGVCTLGAGLVNLDDLYSDVVTNAPWTTNTYYVNSYMSPLLVTDYVSTIKFQATDSGLVAGSTIIKVLFV